MSCRDRRVFLRDAGRLGACVAGLAALSSACGLVASQGPARVPRIGYLALGPREAIADRVEGFLEGLRDLGYIEGKTIAIEWRFTAEGKFAELAADLVRLAVDVIVPFNGVAALAARDATSTIPIVAVGVTEPVAAGLVASLAQPGANVTVVGAIPPGFVDKQIDFLRDVVPGLARLVVLLDPANPGSVPTWAELQKLAEQVGFQVERIDLHSATDAEEAFAHAALSRADAVADLAQSITVPARAQIAELALRHRLPGMSQSELLVQAGLLMSYGPNFPAMHRRAAVFVDKILKGAKPADLPAEQPTLFDLVVNLKTLQLLGLSIPTSVLPLVTKWIQ